MTEWSVLCADKSQGYTGMNHWTEACVTQIIDIDIITRSMRALWLVNQLWVIVPVNPTEKSRVFWIII